jgi:hypothetical protein
MGRPAEHPPALNIGVLEGQSSQWVEQRLPMALEHGVSAFISMGDDPVAMQRFAEEVAPELRNRVASVRGWCNRGIHGDHTFAT